MKQLPDPSTGHFEAAILDGGDRFVLLHQTPDTRARLFSSVDGDNWLTISLDETPEGARQAAAWEDTGQPFRGSYIPRSLTPH